MKKNNIGVLIIMVVLLVIALPAAIYGTYMHFKSDSLSNKNKEFYYEGKLFFYDKDILLGTYTCKSKDCGYAKNYISNDNIESFNKSEKEISLINNRYAFIQDGKEIVLYDVKNKLNIVTYNEVKNYGVGLEDNSYFVKNSSNLWGLIKITDTISVIIPNSYLFLGIKGNLTKENKFSTERMIARTANEWSIINNKNEKLASASSKIVNFSDKFIVTEDNKIYDYNNNQILNNYNLSNIKLLGNIIVGLVNESVYYIYNTETNKFLSTIPKAENEYNFTIENGNLIVKSRSTVIKTIALN